MEVFFMSYSPCSLNRPLSNSYRFEPFPQPPKESLKIAFLNTLTTYVSDGKRNIRKNYPQYNWASRCAPMIELIQKDRPAVLGLCELDLRQIKSFQAEMKEGGKLQRYKLVGYAAQTSETIEEGLLKYNDDEQLKYGEFVAFLLDEDQVNIEGLSLHVLPSEKDQKWTRIILQARLFSTAMKIHFVSLASHFDHLSLNARRRSAQIELDIIRDLEDRKIPWFSMGDRNWAQDQDGELCSQDYLQEPFVQDFRDGTEYGTFGPPGTFPGHLWLQDRVPYPVIELQDGTMVIDAPTIDTGYYSKNLSKSLYYYAKTGEFNPDSGELLTVSTKESLVQRNLVSDHYLFGGVFIAES
jgi:endonuclease/exonuclease/phosphatase family metal-dependent hydrolase